MTDKSFATARATLFAWERALTWRLLTVDGSGDPSAILSFEVTPETIVQAGADIGLDGQESALRSFKFVVCSGDRFDRALREGPPAEPAREVPGYFCYLVLTLLVASLPGEHGGSAEHARLGGPFREKLAEFLESDRTFMQLHGVELMWKALVDWLAARQADGLPVRRLVLPPVPPSWTHIGISLRLAFPTKSDGTLLTNFIAEHPGIEDEPREFVARFRSRVESGRRSEGMRQAFDDFQASLLSGNRYLADHRFWKFVRTCIGAPEAPELEYRVECSFDEDGTPIFALLAASSRMPEKQGALGVVAGDLEETKGSTGRLLVFRQAGYGRWRAVVGDDEILGRVHIGCSADGYRRLREYRPRFAASGDWFFTIDPVSPAVAEACIDLIADARRPTMLHSVSVSGGIMTDGLWLGRPLFLPRIRSSSTVVSIRRGRGAAGNLRVEEERDASEGFRLMAEAPVSGEWFAEDGSHSWSRRIHFARSAVPHGSLDSQAAGFPELFEWRSESELRVGVTAAKSGCDDGDRRMNDLVEAVYAGGRAGWGEGDLVEVVRDAFGSDENPWAVIRSLCDATILTPRVRQRWKGRVWTLRPPSLRRLGDVAFAEGAVCEVQSEGFWAAARAVGAEPFRIAGATPTAPLLNGCRGGELDVLAGRLGWNILPPIVRITEQPLAFVETKLTKFGRSPASRWDWERRRFVADAREGDGSVRLTRWAQSAGNDHDVYVVEDIARSREYRFLSRSIAVVAAHAVARVPLFSESGGFLIGQCREAFLPDLLAERLRLQHAVNAGVFAGTYVYRTDERELDWLNRLLPGLIVSDRKIAGISAWDAAAAARHSRGRLRPAWQRGQLSVHRADS